MKEGPIQATGYHSSDLIADPIACALRPEWKYESIQSREYVQFVSHFLGSPSSQLGLV